MTFGQWWERKGWWFARKYGLSEEVMKEIWDEVCKHGLRD
jgi:hypothetical protein